MKKHQKKSKQDKSNKKKKEKKAALTEKNEQPQLSWGSKKVLREIAQDERRTSSRLDGSARMFQHGADIANLPKPGDKEGIRNYLHERMGMTTHS
jgi:hypothetical protein